MPLRGADDPILLIESTAAETDALLELRNSNAATDKPPILVFNRSDDSAEADDMSLGAIKFHGVDAGNNPTDFITIDAIASDVVAGDEGGKLTFNVFAGGTAGTAASANLFSIGGEDASVASTCEVAVNDAGIDCNFRVESDGETHMLFVDAGSNRVSIGDDTDGPSATFEVTNANHANFNTTLVQLNNNEADQIALDINAVNTTANIIDITANDTLTTGKVIAIDHNDAATAAGVSPVGISYDFDKDGNVGSGVDCAYTGISLNLKDAATGNNSASTVTMKGIDIVVDSDQAWNGGGDNYNTNIGATIECTDATVNYGLVITTENGATNADILMKSSANAADYAVIATNADGALTIQTVDADAAAANLTMTIDGAIKLDGAGVEIENDSATGAPALLIDNDDTDQIALSIAADNINAPAVHIDANAITTVAAVNITASALTTGTGLALTSTSTHTGGHSTLAKFASIGERGHDSNSHIGVYIDYDSTAGAAAKALYIDSEQTTGIVIDTDATAITTGKGQRISLGNMTTGIGLKLDHNDTQTASVTGPKTFHVDFDKTGVAADESEQVFTAQKIDMHDAATNHTDSEVIMTALDIDVDSANVQGTTINTGISVSVTDAATNTGIEITAEDGAGSDIQLKSSADGGDYCTIATIADGETIITTTEAGGGSTAHLNFVVDGNISASANNGSNTYQLQASNFGVTVAGDVEILRSVGVGVPASASLGMNVHHNPTSLKIGTGGGEVVAFGTESPIGAQALVAGYLYCMQDDGAWCLADADLVVSSSALLGIALGGAVSDGILLRGYFHMASASVSDHHLIGQPCYISEDAGHIDWIAPSAAGDTVRVIGYGTPTANLIYFDPDKTWIEL